MKRISAWPTNQSKSISIDEMLMWGQPPSAVGQAKLGSSLSVGACDRTSKFNSPNSSRVAAIRESPAWRCREAKSSGQPSPARDGTRPRPLRSKFRGNSSLVELRSTDGRRRPSPHSSNPDRLLDTGSARFSQSRNYPYLQNPWCGFQMNPAKSRVRQGFCERRKARLHHFLSSACERAALD